MAKKINKTQLLEDLKNFKIESIDKTIKNDKVVYTITLGEQMSKVNKMDLILNELKEIKSNVGQIKSDVDSLKLDVDSLKLDVAELKTDVKQLKTEAIKHG